ncbi:flagellar basal body P-ring formation chaperone FlgA [Polycladidibacter stylochi]|uniref:flagellar basal body P-ring formation chaperone FlgA n=1 Tax=Polycladidibacter stylochi TaxID=1807766 RepID=UPI0009EC6004|nr:flagellar basal body P-ring formation chaperone FlgA [Pseudovibrio stylochi]
MLLIDRLIRFFVVVTTLLLVSLSAQAARPTITLPVPVVVIYPGDLISVGMVTEKRFYQKSIGNMSVVRNPSKLIGQEARRTLLPGQPIPFNALRKPILIKRGAAATLIFKENGLEIRAVVEALESGSVGDIIKARNMDTDLNVTGEIQEDGTLLAKGG